MLSNIATISAGPCPFATPCGERTAHAPCAHVTADDTRRTRPPAARGCDAHAARLDKRAVPSRHRAHARRPQPGRHAGEHRVDDLQVRVDEDDPAADRLHERAETETNA